MPSKATISKQSSSGLVLVGLIIVLLPLVSKVSILNKFGIHNPEKIAELIFILGSLGLGYFLHRDIKIKTKPLVSIIVASITLVVIAKIGIYQPPNRLEILRLLSLIWSIPLLMQLRNKYSAQKISLIIIGVLLVHAQWAVAQIAIQSDLGAYMIGESQLSRTTPGVAKFATPFGKLIRGYGPYAHANSLGGALAIGMLLLVSTQNYIPKKITTTAHTTFIIGVIASLSRLAFVSILITYFFRIKYFSEHKNNPIKKIFLLILIVIFLSLIFIRFHDPEDISIKERGTSITWATTIIQSQNFLQGAGPGYYTHALKIYLDSRQINYDNWQLDFVHSVPLIFISEWGVFSSIIIACIVAYSNAKKKLIKNIIVIAPLVPIILLDHYALTHTSVALLIITSAIVTAKPSNPAGKEVN